MTKREQKDRTQMVKAMDFIVRHINNEDYIEPWLMCGVADGDIEYGDFEPDDPNVDYYIDNDNYGDLQNLFLKLMARAYKNGGLCE